MEELGPFTYNEDRLKEDVVMREGKLTYSNRVTVVVVMVEVMVVMVW